MAKDQNVINGPVELTKDGLEELKDELKELEEVKLPQVVERVAAAREKGDLSENADYQSGKEEQEFVQTRIDEIKDVLARAKVVQQTRSTTIVGVGSLVSIVIKGKAQKKYSYQIVGEFEADPEEGKVSSVSPLGKALMGKKKGDEVKVKAPAGEVMYQIKEIK